MKIKPESVVIVSNPKGAVAYLRYANRKYDCNVSSFSKELVYQLIEKEVAKVNE